MLPQANNQQPMAKLTSSISALTKQWRESPGLSGNLAQGCLGLYMEVAEP